MSIRLKALSLRLAVVVAMTAAALAGTGSAASASTGNLYHGDDYMYLYDSVSYNDSVAVCDAEWDGHLVWADYYSYVAGYKRLYAPWDGICAFKDGNGDSIYQYRICEDTVGCTGWRWATSPDH